MQKIAKFEKVSFEQFKKDWEDFYSESKRKGKNTEIKEH